MYGTGLARAVELAVLAVLLFALPIVAAAALVDVVLSATGVWVLKQPVSELLLILGVLVLLVAVFLNAWSRMVLSRSALIRYLRSKGYSVEGARKRLTAKNRAITIQFELGRPFMDYWPVPRTIILNVDGKRQFGKLGSFDPRYMYRNGKVTVISSQDVKKDVAGIKEMIEQQSGHRLVAQAQQTDKEFSVILNMGRWLGRDYLKFLELTIKSIGIAQ